MVTREGLDQIQKLSVDFKPVLFSQHLPPRKTERWPAQVTPRSQPPGSSLKMYSIICLLAFHCFSPQCTSSRVAVLLKPTDVGRHQSATAASMTKGIYALSCPATVMVNNRSMFSWTNPAGKSCRCRAARQFTLLLVSFSSGMSSLRSGAGCRMQAWWRQAVRE